MEEEKKDVVSSQDGNGNETKEDSSKKDETKQEGKKEEKKEGGFKKWWNSTKKSIDDSVLEGNLTNAYNDAHHRFDVYPYGAGLFSTFGVYGEIVDGKLTYLGDSAVEKDSVVVDSKDNKAYYAKEETKTDVAITYQGTDYKRPGYVLTLDPSVEEVKVIKADKRYFLYKGEKK